MNVKIKYRVFKSKLIQVLTIVLAFVCTLPLIAILAYIFKQGITKINWAFLTQLPKPVGVKVVVLPMPCLVAC